MALERCFVQFPHPGSATKSDQFEVSSPIFNVPDVAAGSTLDETAIRWVETSPTGSIKGASMVRCGRTQGLHEHF